MTDESSGLLQNGDERRLSALSDNQDERRLSTLSNPEQDGRRLSGESLSPPEEGVPTYRKHSSGDLHSRLKTRKLLGVGETDDGDVHRSKLSQILGHSEQLYVKLPKGLRIWQLANALMFSIVGFWALFFPINLFSFAVTSETDPVVILPIRLYGAALLTLAIMFWSTLWSLDRDTIRWSLRGSVLYFTVQFIVWSLSWFSVSHPGVAIGVLDVLLSLQGACVFIGPLVLSLPALFFYPSIGTKHNW